MGHSQALEFIDGFVSVAAGLSPTHMCKINKVLGLASRSITPKAARMALNRDRGCSVQEVWLEGLGECAAIKEIGQLAPCLSWGPAPVLLAHPKCLCVSDP